MKKYLLFFFLFIIALPIFSQRDSIIVSYSAVNKNYSRENTNVNVTIFPVPVRNNVFNIKSEKEISYVKVTNIIGQDVFKSRFSEQQLVRIVLDNAKRGMYIVTILFSDDTRVIKKIMVEETD